MSVSGHIVGMTIGGSRVVEAYYNGQLVFGEQSTPENDTPYVMFSSTQQFDVVFAGGMQTWDGVIEYSDDAETWYEWDGSHYMVSMDPTDSLYKGYFRGTGNTILTGDGNYGFQVTGQDADTFEYSVTGNLLSLMDYTQASPAVDDYCWYQLFCQETSLVAAPDITLSEIPAYGCFHMFEDCKKLTTPPKVTAKIIGPSACYGMFYQCEALTETPKLSFTGIGSSGCREMFFWCPNLKKATLPTNTISVGGSYAFSDMFSSCYRLSSVSAPNGIRVKLANADRPSAMNDIFSNMFDSCGGLTEAPDFYIEGGDLTEAFYRTFQLSAVVNGGSITITGSATCGDRMFESMYEDCTALTSLPKLTGNFTFGLPSECYKMFAGCSKLSQLYAFTNLGDNTVIADSSFTQMFSRTAIDVAPYGTYNTSFTLVKDEVTTEADIDNFTEGGTNAVSPLLPNTMYSTNATKIVMVN